MRISSTLLAVLAIIAGALILFDRLSLSLIVGVFLIAFGMILTLIRR